MNSDWVNYYRRQAWQEQRFYRLPSSLTSPPSTVDSNNRNSRQLPAPDALHTTTATPRRKIRDVDHDGATPISEPGHSSSLPPDPQAASPFFNCLPLELRHMVWAALWSSYCDGGGGCSGSLGHTHIYTPDNRRLSFSPCCIYDPGHDDTQEKDDLELLEDAIDTLLLRERGGLDVREEKRVWGRRMRSDWGGHWRCEEEALRLDRLGVGDGDADTEIGLRDSAAGRPKKKGSLLSVLLACKRMNQEATMTLAETATFIFTDVDVAHHFFVVRPPSQSLLSQLRTLHLDIETIECGLHPSQHDASSSSLPSLAPGQGCSRYPWEALTFALTDTTNSVVPSLENLQIRVRDPATSLSERLAFARFFDGTWSGGGGSTGGGSGDGPVAAQRRRRLTVEFPRPRPPDGNGRRANMDYTPSGYWLSDIVEAPYSLDFWKPPFTFRRTGRRPKHTSYPHRGIVRRSDWRPA
ncbi:hypothetical protein SLS62_003017 [Diatrype stigma]|uniref:Uncharacterized protein n=1 Tax=Diatrype stigma TaxID=117547 RepID=A0AAN9UVF6_9PEZI